MALTNLTDYAGKKGALVAWSDGLLGAGRTIWSRRDYPRVTRPYGVFHITAMGRDEGIDERSEVFNAGVIETTYIGVREMSVLYSIYTPPPSDYVDAWPQELMQEALLRLAVQSQIDAFRAVNLAFRSHTPIRENDQQDGDRWEWVAEVDLILSYRTTLFDDGLGTPPDDGQYIDEVEININEEPPFTVDVAGTGVFTPDFTPDFE